MADSFTKDQFQWLRQVAADCKLPSIAGTVAIALTQYFNRKNDGWAWMSQPTLADDLGISVSTVRRALSAMVLRGHLISKRRGKEETNLYQLILKNGASDRADLNDHDRAEMNDHTDGVTVQSCNDDRADLNDQGQSELNNKPFEEEPSEEPIEGVTHPKSQGNGSRSGRRSRAKIPLPDDFALTDAMIGYAGDKAGWNPARTADEFEGFCIFHRKTGSSFADWEAAWQSWVRKGAGFDKQRAGTGGAVIDQEGNPVSAPPPWQHQRREPFRRRSNTEMAFKEWGDD